MLDFDPNKFEDDYPFYVVAAGKFGKTPTIAEATQRDVGFLASTPPGKKAMLVFTDEDAAEQTAEALNVADPCLVSINSGREFADFLAFQKTKRGATHVVFNLNPRVKQARYIKIQEVIDACQVK